MFVLFTEELCDALSERNTSYAGYNETKDAVQKVTTEINTWKFFIGLYKVSKIHCFVLHNADLNFNNDLLFSYQHKLHSVLIVS